MKLPMIATTAQHYGKEAQGVVIVSEQLLTALVQNNAATIKTLAQIAPLKASDITISASGQIFIAGKEFASAYFDNPETANLMCNTYCNGTNVHCS